jgi:hypothetical protein
MRAATQGRSWFVPVLIIAILVGLVSYSALRERPHLVVPPLATSDVDTLELSIGAVQLPSSWSHVSREGRNGGLAMAASPRQEMLEGVVQGNGATSLAVRQDLRLDDAYVEVWTNYQPVEGGIDAPELGERLHPSDFEPVEVKFGEPIYSYHAVPEDGGLVSFVYWAGPEVSEAHRQEMLDMIRSLRFD